MRRCALPRPALSATPAPVYFEAALALRCPPLTALAERPAIRCMPHRNINVHPVPFQPWPTSLSGFAHTGGFPVVVTRRVTPHQNIISLLHKFGLQPVCLRSC